MSARPSLNNVALSTWVQPFQGEKSKTLNIQTASYNGQQTNAATGDTVSCSADYGIYDTTNNINIDVNSTNFKDPT